MAHSQNYKTAMYIWNNCVDYILTAEMPFLSDKYYVGHSGVGDIESTVCALEITRYS
jgi:hypothetical protein